MRIALVCRRFLPYTGGVELHVAALAQELARAGDCPVVVTGEPKAPSSSDIPGDLEVMRVPSWTGFPAALRRLEPDVVHVHLARSPYAAIAGLAAARERISVVFTPHCFYPKWNLVSGLKKTTFDMILGTPLLKRSSAIICLTDRDRADAITRGAPADRVVMIPAPSALPPPLSVPEPDPAWAQRRGIGPFMLFVGRLAPAKRVDFLVKALSTLDEQDLHLVVIGPDDGDRADLVTLATQLGLHHRVHFLGAVSREDLQAAYASCSLFVLPSAFEGQPVVLLEAMAYGKVVIATDVAGNRSVIQDGHNGLLYPLDDLETFRRLVHRVRSTDVKNLGRNAREIVLQQYSWDAVTPRIRSVYRDCIEAAGRGSSTSLATPAPTPCSGTPQNP